MKTVDTNPKPTRLLDQAIHEVSQIKKEIIADYGGDIRQLLKSLRDRQMSNPRLTRKMEGEQAAAGQPATRLVVEPEGGDQPQPEAEWRSL